MKFFASLAILSLFATVRAQTIAPANNDAIQRELTTIATALKVPALGGAIVHSDGQISTFVTGVRESGSDVAATVTDQWHLGSCTKAMTAMLVALLVERGDLTWDRPLAFAAEPRRANGCGLRTTHAGRITRASRWAAKHDRPRRRPAGRERTRRHRSGATQRTLPPHPQPKAPTPPRQAFVYSNAGFIVAGHIAEVATGKSFETLLRELLFVPLDMQSAGFGAPGTNNNLDQPRGHDAAGKPVQPRPNGDNVPLLGPAGTVHASLADWGKFLRLHLLGDAADVQVGAITLHRETIARLHTAWDDANPYAYGFSMPHRDWARGLHTVLTHSGSNTMWFCVCWLDPSSGFGVLAVANSAGHDALEACDRVSGLLLNNWLARRKLAEQAKPAEAMPAVTPAFLAPLRHPRTAASSRHFPRSEHPDDVALVVDVDPRTTRDFAEARHRHDLASQRVNEPGTDRNARIAHLETIASRPALQRCVVR